MFMPDDSSTRTVSLEVHNGKARLDCTIKEDWVEVFKVPLRCGNKFRRLIRRRTGISRTDRDEFESTVATSLGMKGIAELESRLRSGTSQEFRFEESCEEEDEFTFQAPKCGRLIVMIYQLRREYTFHYRDDRLLRRADWTKTLEERRNRISDQSRQIENDPDCGCSQSPSIGSDGDIVLDSASFNMLLEYKKENGRIVFPRLKMYFETNRLQELTTGEFDIQREAFPQYLLFVSGEAQSSVRVKFSLPYIEEPQVAGVESVADQVSGQQAEARAIYKAHS